MHDNDDLGQGRGMRAGALTRTEDWRYRETPETVATKIVELGMLRAKQDKLYVYPLGQFPYDLNIQVEVGENLSTAEIVELTRSVKNQIEKLEENRFLALSNALDPRLRFARSLIDRQEEILKDDYDHEMIATFLSFVDANLALIQHAITQYPQQAHREFQFSCASVPINFFKLQGDLANYDFKQQQNLNQDLANVIDGMEIKRLTDEEAKQLEQKRLAEYEQQQAEIIKRQQGMNKIIEEEVQIRPKEKLNEIKGKLEKCQKLFTESGEVDDEYANTYINRVDKIGSDSWWGSRGEQSKGVQTNLNSDKYFFDNGMEIAAFITTNKDNLEGQDAVKAIIDNASKLRYTQLASRVPQEVVEKFNDPEYDYQKIMLEAIRRELVLRVGLLTKMAGAGHFEIAGRKFFQSGHLDKLTELNNKIDTTQDISEIMRKIIETHNAIRGRFTGTPTFFGYLGEGSQSAGQLEKILADAITAINKLKLQGIENGLKLEHVSKNNYFLDVSLSKKMQAVDDRLNGIEPASTSVPVPKTPSSGSAGGSATPAA